jgi:hypothetical protein
MLTKHNGIDFYDVFRFLSQVYKNFPETTRMKEMVINVVCGILYTIKFILFKKNNFLNSCLLLLIAIDCQHIQVLLHH